MSSSRGQDREESLSSATVQFTAELARSERRRQDSESAAREASDLQRVAEERVRVLEREADEQQRASQEKDSMVSQLQQALDARDTDQESEHECSKVPSTVTCVQEMYLDVDF